MVENQRFETFKSDPANNLRQYKGWGLDVVHRVRMVRVDADYVDAVIRAAGHTRETYEGPFPFPDGTTEIGQMAFREYYSLKEARIPETVTKIESNAFTDCLSLEIVTLPKNLKVLEHGVFLGCFSLGAIVIPENVKEIEPFALGRCESLKGINFLGMPEYIDWEAFQSTRPDFIVLPNSLFHEYFHYEDDAGRQVQVHSLKKMLRSAKIVLYKEESSWYWKLGSPYEKIEVPAMTKVLMNKSAYDFSGPSMSRPAIDRALAKEPFFLPPRAETNLRWLDFSRKLFPRLPDEIRLMIINFINGNVTAGLTELLKTFDVSRAIAPAGALYDHTV